MNLIATCSRHFESETSEEIGDLLEDLGDQSPKITFTGLPGIISIETALEPTLVIKKIKEKIINEPWSIRYLLRLIPIQSETSTNLEEIQNKVNILTNEFEEKQTYRITIEKRHSNISSKEIISTIAENIQNKVSLENPDWIILIEVVGSRTGISVLKKEDILSVTKEKRQLSE